MSANWKSSCELGVSSAPQTSTTFGTIDTIGCSALDLCAATMAQQEVGNPSLDSFQCGHWSWRNCVADERDYACEKVSGPAVAITRRRQVILSKDRDQSVWRHTNCT